MAGQDSNDNIAGLLKQACPPAAASPVFKAKLRQQVNQQATVLGTQVPKPLWQQPFVWIPAAAASVVAVALAIFFVAFQSVPPSVKTSDATNIQATAASLSGRLSSLSGSESVEASFEWGATTDYGNETIPELRTEAGDITADLSGLTPNTTYHFRLKVVGGKGTSYGPDMQFVTGPAPPVMTTNDATNVMPTSATLNGTLDSMGTEDNVRVSFEWGTARRSYTQTTADQARASVGAFSADLSGLTPGTTYYYRAKADGDGAPVYGQEKSLTTSTRPPAVTTNDATNVTTASATLNGDLTSLGTAGTVMVSFEWGTERGSYAHTTADQARTGIGAFSADLSGLTPGTTYYYRAKAHVDGAPVYGKEKSFATPTTAPSVATRGAINVTTASATLNGDLTSLGTAGRVIVSFEWGIRSGSYTYSTGHEATTVTGDFSADLSGLTPGTTYYYRAKADGDGLPAYGDEENFTTSTAPPSVTTSSATEVRCTLATLNGILESLGTANSVQVSFEWGPTTAYGSETASQLMTGTSSFSANLENLMPRTTYHFRAKAVGDGIAYGADMVFTTGREMPPQKTWYLTKGLSGSVKVMYEGDTSKREDSVRLRDSGPTSWAWRANQSSGETTYPEGNWTVQLTLGSFEVGHTDSVEVGTWDGSMFTPYGAYTIHGLGQDDEVYVVAVSIDVGSFTVPPEGYVAVRITVTSSPQSLDVHLGGSQSYVQSPAYPEPNAPSAITNAATSVGQTTAILNGCLDNLGSASSVAVCFEWGTTADYGMQVEVESQTSEGRFAFPLSDLAPNTTYHFRTKAVGDGANYGVDMIFTTLP